MKKNPIVLFFIVFLLIFLSSCNKESDIGSETNTQNKSAIMGDKIFTGDAYSKLFAYYSGMPDFANNNGEYNFTIADIPGTESGFKANGSGYFKYLNVNYPLTWGHSYWLDENQFFIGLADYKMESGGNISTSNIAGFQIISGEADKITSGYYQFDQTQNPFTFHFAYIDINLTNQFDPEKYIHFEDGDIHISKSGNTTLINFNGLLDNGHTVTGSFTGQLAEFVSDQ